MNENSPSTSDWGAPAPEKTARGGKRKAVTAGAAAAVLAVGGGAAIWAAGSSADADTASAAPGGGAGTGGAPGSPALHGEYVVSDGKGGYTTRLTQTGKVTEMSATSLTAVSDDGYSKVYTIDPSVVNGVTTGETVTVVATTSGTTATAQSVRESTGEGQGPPQNGGTPPGQ
ncbi:hypothetical protein [Amycolatopsis pittospori]|uniref:hypothetical protein n=1 Tax=Amycolatopsis pittospori TaxID=2749434 RepID=UPI0015F07A01|nr:hypothetical protein [Amycolatopsis pittospori]